MESMPSLLTAITVNVTSVLANAYTTLLAVSLTTRSEPFAGYKVLYATKLSQLENVGSCEKYSRYGGENNNSK